MSKADDWLDAQECLHKPLRRRRYDCRECIREYGDMRAQEERERYAGLVKAAWAAEMILLSEAKTALYFCRWCKADSYNEWDLVAHGDRCILSRLRAALAKVDGGKGTDGR